MLDDRSDQLSLEVMVEIPQGSRNKYEYDERRRVFRLDRVLYTSVHYPADYGFIPETRAEDGDPLDALVITTQPTFPGCLIPVRPIGVLDMRDEKGIDEKILCVPTVDPHFAEITRLDDLPAHWLREIETFFETYKLLEPGKRTELVGWRGVEVALDLIQTARERYRQHRPAP